MNLTPIIMSAPSILAILDGRKTQTMRVIKGAPSGANSVATISGKVRFYGPLAGDVGAPLTDWIKCPYGSVGDRLYVKESFTYWEAPSGEDFLVYKADGAKRSLGYWPHPHPVYEHCVGRFRKTISPMFMPRWAARLTPDITGIKVM